MKKNIFLFTALFVCINIFAQSKKLTIKVLDAQNKPVAGATILFDDIKQKRWTNSNGIFKIKSANAPKEISAFHPKIGIQKIKYTGAKKVFIKIKKGENLLTVNNNNSKEKVLNPTQFYTIYDYLKGRIPGVNVTSDNKIAIRGYNTVNGNTTPLFILNGTNIDQDFFGTISPSDIKSIKVLKGPETAVYGVRGANGVIIVTTM